MGSCNTSDNEKGQLDLIKQNYIIENIKSKYILQNIFNYIDKKTSLEIMKYNKKMQNRINRNINEYKEYSGKYSSIVIEIIPTYNVYSKFINIRKRDEKFYHIYFNNNKDETKRNHFNKDDKINKINIIIDYQIKSFKGLFYGCECIESINFKKFARNNINDMSFMFCNCSNLKEIVFSNFNTDNVYDMSSMFSGCSLKEINISNFNTNNVIKMNGMFSNCSSLKIINISNFNTNNVNDMDLMFYGCSSLKELNLSNFNTNNVTIIHGMFYGCSDEFKAKIRARYKNVIEKTFYK